MAARGHRALARALLHDEQLLILDEPTHGLDPVWTQRFRGIVEGLRSPDQTIGLWILSTRSLGAR